MGLSTVRSLFSTTPLFQALLLFTLLTINVPAQVSTELGIGVGSPDNNNEPRDPDHLIDNIWWVGHTRVGSFLITTPEGHILMDTTSAEEVHDVVENIVKAGFHLRDIKYIINTHAHGEHISGLATMKRLLPHAKIITSKDTAAILAVADSKETRSEGFEPVKVDGYIGDKEELKLGGVTMAAHLTPGHAKGVTTWTMKVTDKGKQYNVVFMGGMGTPTDEDEGTLLNNEMYPEILADFENSFKRLRSLPCDVFMTYRALSIDLDGKVARRKQDSNAANPFIDPKSCQAYIDLYYGRFTKQLAEEKKAAGTR